MDLPQDLDDYIKQSIESSLDLPVSATTLRVKLIASDAARRRLQDHALALQERLAQSTDRISRSKAEASTSAQGLKRCVEEIEVMKAEYKAANRHYAEMEKEHGLCGTDVEKFIECYGGMAMENEELLISLEERPSIESLVTEIKSLEREKENLRVDLQKAEEEVNILHEENDFYEQENRRLLGLLNGDEQHNDSGHNHNFSGKGKA